MSAVFQTAAILLDIIIVVLNASLDNDILKTGQISFEFNKFLFGPWSIEPKKGTYEQVLVRSV